MHLFTVAFGLLCLALAPVQKVPPGLLSAIDNHLKTRVVERPSFRHVLVDLNQDGTLDAIVLLQGPDWCGSGGCDMLVFRGTSKGFRFVSGSTITFPPIRVLAEKRHGWSTLVVRSGGTGDVLMRFDGRRYPLNPSLQPKTTRSEIGKSTLVLQ